MLQQDWDTVRENKYSTERPSSWPPMVRGISGKGLALLGVHEKTGELYWDGRRLVIDKPITLGRVERVLASLAAFSALGLFVVEVGRSAKWWAG